MGRIKAFIICVSEKIQSFLNRDPKTYRTVYEAQTGALIDYLNSDKYHKGSHLSLKREPPTEIEIEKEKKMIEQALAFLEDDRNPPGSIFSFDQEQENR